MKSIHLATLTLLGISALGTTARAASDTWTGTTDATWATSTNWLGGGVPGTGDTATFNGASGNTAIDLGAGVTIGSVLFDTSSAAAYTIGSGAVGSQTLTLGTTGNAITMNSTVAADELFNANLALSVTATPGTTSTYYAVTNNSLTNLLTLAGGISASTAGVKVLNVTGSGNTAISGAITSGAGNMSLFKTGSGTLTLSGGGTFSGNGIKDGANFASSAVFREGTTILNGGAYNDSNGELVIGGVATPGGVGTNTTLQLDNGATLTNMTWLSIGRGNGNGTATSNLTLNGSSSITSTNMSAGFNAGNAGNIPKGTVTLNGTSSLEITNTVNFAESAGSNFTMNINDTAIFKQTANANQTKVGMSDGAVGVINVNGGTATFERDFILGAGGTGSGKLVLNSGTVNVATTTERWLKLNDSASASTGQVDINGGNLNLNTNADLRFSTNGGAAGTNVVNLNAGAITGWVGNGTGGFSGTSVVDLNQGSTQAGVSNTFNLNGGTLTIGQVITSRDEGNAAFNFNGGTLRAAAASANFVDLGGANQRANVRNGGAIIDPNGFNVTLVEALVHSNIGGDNAIDGGLRVNGTGTLALGGTNTYTGATTVNAGTLQLSGAGDVNTSSGIVVNGATAKLLQTSFTDISTPVTLTNGTLAGNTIVNSVTVGAGTGGIVSNGLGGTDTSTLTVNSLTFSGAGTMNLTTSNFSGPLLATTNLTTTGANSVSINVTNTDKLWTNASYSLVSYSTLGGTGFTGLKVGTLPLLGGRQTATLSDSGSEVSLAIGGILPVWTGSVDGTWTAGPVTNWQNLNGGAATNFVDGDTVIFDDTATGNTNLQITGATVTPVAAKFSNSTLDYSVSSSGGFGIGGTGTLIKEGSAALTLNTANTYSGGTSLNGGTLNLNNASAIGTGALTVADGATIDNTSGGAITLSTNNAQTWNGNITFGGTNALNMGTGAVSLTGNQIVTVNGNAPVTLGGVVSGAFSFTKTGPGTLTLAGANTYSGGTTVSQGTLNLTGTLPAGAITLDPAFDTTATFNTSGTIALANGNLINVGSNFGGTGILNVTGGTISGGNQDIRAGNGGYGVVNVTGGSVTPGAYVVAGIGTAGSAGIWNISGGTVQTAGNTSGTLGATAGTFGLANVTGTGSYASTGNTANGASGIFVGEAGNGVLNVSGGGSLTLGGIATSAGLDIGRNNVATSSGVVNLGTGGTIATNIVRHSGAAASGIFNFHGGTLKAATGIANTGTTAGTGNSFMGGLTGAYVYGEGGTIDNNGQNITITQSLLAPTLSGATAISTTGFPTTTGFTTAPLVSITGGTGTGMTANAVVDGSGNLTGFVVTNPGSGYTPGDTITVALNGGGYGTVTSSDTAVTLGANTSGGLTFTGTGTTTLSAANTYAGTTNLNAGKLLLTNTTGSATGTGALNVASGATLGGTGTAAGAVTVASGGIITPGLANSIGNLTVGSLTLSAGSIINEEITDSSTRDLITVTTSGGLVINGGGYNLYQAGGTNPFTTNGTYNVIGYTGAIGGTGVSALSVLNGVGGKAYTFNTSGGFVTLAVSNAGVLANYWNINADGNWTTGSNWSLGSAPNGAGAFANFGGGGATITAPRTVTLNADQTVGSIGFNSAQSYTISGANTLTLDNDADPTAQISDTNGSHTLAVNLAQGGAVTNTQFNVVNAADTLTFSGVLSGATGLQKLSAGNLVLSGANTYVGASAIDGGKVTMSGAGTLGNPANTLAVTNATLDLGATSQTTGAATFSAANLVNGTLTSASYGVSGAGDTTIGAVLAGTGALTMSGTGTLTFTNAQAYTGGTTINAGGTVQLGDGTTNGSLTGTVLNNGTLTYKPVGSATIAANAITNNGSLNFNVAGSLTQNAGNGAFTGGGTVTKTGTGTLNLSAVNTSGVTTVNGGTLKISAGSLTTGGAGNTAIVGSGAANSILDISGGAFTANTTGNQFTSSLVVGNAAGAAGAIHLNTGSLTANQQFGLGGGLGGYAAMTMTGGTVTSGSYLVVGFNNDRAVFNQTGGSFTVNTNIMTIGAGGTGSIGVVSIGGNASFTSIGTTGNSPGGIIVGERGRGELNVSGTASLTLGNTGLSVGPTGAQNGWSGTANLLGGTITTTHISKGLGSGTAIVNFNGGTVRASVGSSTFIDGLDGAYVYSGGAKIDTNGFDVTVGQALSAPTDTGVSSIALSAVGTGYIDRPIVTITGGTLAANGTAATAVADIDPVTGQVTGITITNPGSYTDTTDLAVTFDGGGNGAVTPTVSTIGTAANVSGGLTKSGAGVLTLSGANTYTGATQINAGTLHLDATGTLNGSTSLSLASGATLQLDTNISLNDNIVLALAGGSNLDLNFDGSLGADTIRGLIVGSTTFGPGTYTMTDLNGFGVTVTGAGSLTVLQAVPEPSVFALFGLGAAGLLLCRRFRARRL
jgi:autotransporter-associated beta strand protein